MELEEIKRGLLAEIKKRENEEFAQCGAVILRIMERIEKDVV